MKATITIMPKKGVLDPQGKAISQALLGLGFEDVGEVRQGKMVTVDVSDETTREQIQDMCEKLLANPVIEDYDIDIEEA